MMFVRGQKVTLKERGRWLICHGECVPEFGAVYTIRDIVSDGVEGEGLQFEELRNIPHEYRSGVRECYFHAFRFRPVVEPRVELPESITKWLDVENHPPVKEPAMAPEAFI